MPLYEYECLECGKKFDVRRGFFEKAKDPVCPECKSEYTVRVFSPVSSAIGGSGGSCSPSPRRFG